MATINGNYFSIALHKIVPFAIVIPTMDYGTYIRNESINIPDKFVILMGGIGEKYNIWFEKDDLERRAQNTKSIILLVEHFNAFAVDLGVGRNYFKYLSEEIFDQMEQMFHLSDYIKKSYIAGISLGGYNAVKLGISTKRFAKVFSYSGVAFPYNQCCDSAEYILHSKSYLDSFFISMEASDLIGYVENISANICLYCGTEDWYLQDNVLLRKRLIEIGCNNVEIEEINKKGHDWNCWMEAYKMMWKQIERD